MSFHSTSPYAHYSADSWRMHGETIAALLNARALGLGDTPFIHLLGDTGGEKVLSFSSLASGARQVAAALQARHVRVGDRVMLILPTGEAFLNCFFGALLAGAVAVPAYPPARQKNLTEYQDRLAALIKVADPTLIITFRQVRVLVEAAAFQAGGNARVLEPEALQGETAQFQPPELKSDALALIQFSSGSTGAPRGVKLSHRNLLANLASVLAVIQPTQQDVNCTWLPLYHDMGLIGGLLMPLFSGNPLVLMSPQAFLLDPKRWLWGMHHYKGTISTAPNFAYQLIASRVDDAEMEGLNLSHWRLALCGAEPVMPQTLDAVCARLGRFGFQREAILPVYGLAEAALGTVFPPVGRIALIDRVSVEALSLEGLAKAVEADDDQAGLFASVGVPLPGFEARVIGPGGHRLSDRHVGEVQLRGPSVMSGYFNDEESTRNAFDGDWLKTGDQGYLASGELYLVGRLKDVVMKGGRNYAPQDLEHAAEEVAGVRKGCTCAFGIPDAQTGTEAVVVVAETREPKAAHGALCQEISDRVQARVGLRPNHVSLVPPGAIPKTSSGKLRRTHCKEQWLTGALKAPAMPGPLAKAKWLSQATAHRTKNQWRAIQASVAQRHD
jgi:acyl-CoA synthetase (AMP-forming)/AMP-acid ligase II